MLALHKYISVTVIYDVAEERVEHYIMICGLYQGLYIGNTIQKLYKDDIEYYQIAIFPKDYYTGRNNIKTYIEWDSFVILLQNYQLKIADYKNTHKSDPALDQYYKNRPRVFNERGNVEKLEMSASYTFNSTNEILTLRDVSYSTRRGNSEYLDIVTKIFDIFEPSVLFLADQQSINVQFITKLPITRYSKLTNKLLHCVVVIIPMINKIEINGDIFAKDTTYSKLNSAVTRGVKLDNEILNAIKGVDPSSQTDANGQTKPSHKPDYNFDNCIGLEADAKVDTCNVLIYGKLYKTTRILDDVFTVGSTLKWQTFCHAKKNYYSNHSTALEINITSLGTKHYNLTVNAGCTTIKYFIKRVADHNRANYKIVECYYANAMKTYSIKYNLNGSCNYAKLQTKLVSGQRPDDQPNHLANQPNHLANPYAVDLTHVYYQNGNIISITAIRHGEFNKLTFHPNGRKRSCTALKYVTGDRGLIYPIKLETQYGKNGQIIDQSESNCKRKELLCLLGDEIYKNIKLKYKL